MEPKYYIPVLKKLSLKNYSLFPGNLNFTYQFVKGINLIIGGNGIGKTTFLNILKYALVGLYKKEMDVKRREYRGIEKRYDKRANLPYEYFRNRMDNTVEYNKEAEVTLTFLINDTEFSVTRDLYEPKVKEVKIKEAGKTYILHGNIITQYEFDNLLLNQSENKNALDNSLQGQYERKIAKLSNHEFFDRIIFLFNEIMFFNESRKTIMWDSIVQGKLTSKYFIDPKLDDEKEKAERDGKYFDSLSRHKSEDIRAIRKIFDKENYNDNNKPYQKLVIEIEEEKKISEKYFKELKKIQIERNKIEIRINTFHSSKNALSKNLEEIENEKRIEEQKIFTNIFERLTPKYYDYLKFLKSSHDCPLCNNKLASKQFEKINNNDLNCMMCGSAIVNTDLTSEKLIKIRKNISTVLSNIRNVEKEIIESEDFLKELDSHYHNTTILFNKSRSKLRKAEFAIQQYEMESNANTDSEFIAMKSRINELEKEKENALNRSKKSYERSNSILEKIDKQRLESRAKLSGIFNKFGGQFLGVNCELVYEDMKNEENKLYLPKIDGTVRFSEEELSESQRFFIDQSFRISLLSYFNEQASFFICETPDSSLDLSYEENAAKIFLEYTKNSNSLILTSNLNNSEFLEYLIDHSKRINYINLLDIGKKSSIQAGSKELLNVSTKIERKINAKIG